jgi:Holliday junction DNA helicase RuvA
MIGYLRGDVVERRVTGDNSIELVVDVGGVGYRVFVSPRLAGSISHGSSGLDGTFRPAEATLWVHTHVREGAITLYGFTDPDERRVFEVLLSAHGVGPALALAIVSVHGADRLVEIVTGEDIDALTLVPGVGRKTALRLIVDLKSRFGELDGAMLAAVSLVGASPPVSREVADALAQLGYGSDEVRRAVRALPAEGSLEELLRLALRELAPRR